MSNQTIFEFANKASLADTDVILIQEDSNGTAFKCTVANLRTSLLDTNITVGGSITLSGATERLIARENETGYIVINGGDGSGGSNGGQFLAFGNSHATLAGHTYIDQGTAAGAEIKFRSGGGGDLAVIDSSGNVIIGTDPGGSQLLRVGGNIYTNGVLTVDTDLFVGSSGTDFGGVGGIAHIYRNTAATATVGGAQLWIENQNTGSGAGSAIGFQSIETASGNRRVTIGGFLDGTNGGKFVVNTRDTAGASWNSEALVVNSSGSVIVGTDPSGSELLRVGGTIRARGSNASATAMVFDTANTSGVVTTWQTNASTKGYIGTGANVIGGVSANDMVIRAENALQIGIGNSVDLTLNSSGDLVFNGGNHLLGGYGSGFFTISGGTATNDGGNITLAGASETDLAVYIRMNGTASGVFDDDNSSGQTRFQLYDNDHGGVIRVKVGSNNTGPGGSGRALYVDNT